MAALLAVDPNPIHDRDEPAGHRRSLRDLVDGFSMEVTPGLSHDMRVTECLLQGTRAFIPWLPGASSDEIVIVAAKLREQGMTPVPHVAARKMPNHAALDRLLRDLHAGAAVDQLLVIDGDAAEPEGEFDCAVEVLQFGALPDRGITRVGVGAYPEGHPHVSDSALLDALLQKQDYAVQSGLDMFVVTQFAFNAAPVAAWLERVRAAGLAVPVHVGVPGPARIGTLMRYARMCGVGSSMKMLLRHGRGLASTTRVATPSRMVQDLAAYQAAHPESGMGPLHIYPFGGLKRTAEWIEDLILKDR